MTKYIHRGFHGAVTPINTDKQAAAFARQVEAIVALFKKDVKDFVDQQLKDLEAKTMNTDEQVVAEATYEEITTFSKDKENTVVTLRGIIMWPKGVDPTKQYRVVTPEKEQTPQEVLNNLGHLAQQLNLKIET